MGRFSQSLETENRNRNNPTSPLVIIGVIATAHWPKATFGCKLSAPAEVSPEAGSETEQLNQCPTGFDTQSTHNGLDIQRLRDR